jgi:hypothetical protein
MVAKPAPLETFLTSVSEARSAAKHAQENASPDTPAAKPETDKGSMESSTAVACRSVILTILHQATTPVPEEELAARSELPTEYYRTAVEDLQRTKLVAAADSGYILTRDGNEAAERERARLLRL